MNPLRAIVNAVTYRTGLPVFHAPLIAESVGRGVIRYSHPGLPRQLEARREHVLRAGLDLADLAMLDEGTRLALQNTARRLAAEQHAAETPRLLAFPVSPPVRDRAA